LIIADEREKSDDNLRIAERRFNYNIIKNCRIEFQRFEKRIIRKMIAEKFFKSKLNVIAVKLKYYYNRVLYVYQTIKKTAIRRKNLWKKKYKIADDDRINCFRYKEKRKNDLKIDSDMFDFDAFKNFIIRLRR
jgi:hypothetical protein